MKHTSKLLHIATLGKTVGLKGDMKLHIKSDFPEQFVSGAEFYLDEKKSIKFASVNMERATVRLEGCATPEAARKFINAKLYTTYEATRHSCKLEAGEFFWFDIIGCTVLEDGSELGRVKDIDRLGEQDYLLVETNPLLIDEGHAKSFLLPYQPPFILKTDIYNQAIEVAGGLDLLQAS